MREKSTPRGLAVLGGAHHTIERRLAADGEVADIQDAFLRRLIGARRIHRHPHLATGDFRIGVGEAEQRAGIDGLEIRTLRPRAAPRRSPVSGVSRPILEFSVKL